MMPWHPAATTLFHAPWPPQPPQQQWHTPFPTQSLFPLSHQSPMPMMHYHHNMQAPSSLYGSYHAPAVMPWSPPTSPWAPPLTPSSLPPMRPPAAQPPPQERSPVVVASTKRPSPQHMPADSSYTTVASLIPNRASPFSVVHNREQAAAARNHVSALGSFAEFANRDNMPEFGTPEPTQAPSSPAVPAGSPSLLDSAAPTWVTKINNYNRRLNNPIVHNNRLAYLDAVTNMYHPVDGSDPFHASPSEPKPLL